MAIPQEFKLGQDDIERTGYLLIARSGITDDLVALTYF